MRGIRRLYQSPPHAWVFDPGQEGVLTSARGIVQVTFFANSIDGKGRVTFRDRRGRVVRKVRVKPADEARRFDLAFFRPVHCMEIGHGASVLAIDDLSFVTR